MINSKSPIGVFDSGLGGISVLGELWKLMPDENYIYYGDSANAPYGTKDEAEIKALSEKNIKTLINMGAKAIVIACNTATSVAAKSLRESYDIPIIGIEPAVKPAAINHKNGKIIVMATPMTLKKEKFTSLMESYSDISRIKPVPCPGLVEIIERGITHGEEVDNYLARLFEAYNTENVDAVVLGCTHYPFVKKAIAKYFDYKADIIDGGMGTARETMRRLEACSLLNNSSDEGSIQYISSKDCSEEIELMKEMFKKSINL